MSFNINVLSGNGGSLYFGGLAGYIERSNIKDITLFVNFSIVTNGINSYFGSLTAFCSESNLK